MFMVWRSNMEIDAISLRGDLTCLDIQRETKTFRGTFFNIFENSETFSSDQRATDCMLNGVIIKRVGAKRVKSLCCLIIYVCIKRVLTRATAGII